jgi:hypothetical protein
MEASFGETGLKNGSGAYGSRLVLADGPIDLSWHHCSTTADFVGDFYAMRSARTAHDVNDARHTISYLINELLENVIKFRAPGDVELETSLADGHFEVRVSNLVDPATATRFQRTLAEITSRDPGELLIERIEANAADDTSTGSGLGLLTLMSDYGARLGWTFTRVPAGDDLRLETYASLKLA